LPRPPERGPRPEERWPEPDERRPEPDERRPEPDERRPEPDEPRSGQEAREPADGSWEERNEEEQELASLRSLARYATQTLPLQAIRDYVPPDRRSRRH
jgi:hypothetical protein